MKVRFKDGVIKDCTSPVEHKLFKTLNGITTGVGWALSLQLTGSTTSTELDSIITPDNVSTLEFVKEDENGEIVTLFSLSGYEKITSSTIRHSEDTMNTHVEIQMTKGL